MSAFKESRDRPRGHGAYLSLVDGKSRDDSEDACADIDLTMDIVKDFSDEIFSNIEQLNRNSLIATHKTDNNSCNKLCTTAIVHLEDETKSYDCNKRDTLTRDSVISNDQKDKTKDDCEQTGASDDSKTLLERRRVSLPEITSLPNIRAIRIR